MSKLPGPSASGSKVKLTPSFKKGLLKRLEIGFYLGSATFQEGWQGQFVPEIGNVFVDCESRTVRCELEKDLARFAEIETLEIVTIDFAAIWDAEIS
jgi:hypothetical protein